MRQAISDLKERIKNDCVAFLSWLTLAKIIGGILIVMTLLLSWMFHSYIIEHWKRVIEKFKMVLDSLDNINTIGFAFWFSIVLLIVISLIKYFIINKENLMKDFGELIMELPIDMCNIVITILASLYLNQHTGKGITLIVLTVGVVTVCAVFRRLSMKIGGFEHFSYLSVIFALADIIIAMFWINFVLDFIKH